MAIQTFDSKSHNTIIKQKLNTSKWELVNGFKVVLGKFSGNIERQHFANQK